jgi:hypothetical protein
VAHLVSQHEGSVRQHYAGGVTDRVRGECGPGWIEVLEEQGWRHRLPGVGDWIVDRSLIRQQEVIFVVGILAALDDYPTVGQNGLRRRVADKGF